MDVIDNDREKRTKMYIIEEKDRKKEDNEILPC